VPSSPKLTKRFVRVSKKEIKFLEQQIMQHDKNQYRAGFLSLIKNVRRITFTLSGKHLK